MSGQTLNTLLTHEQRVLARKSSAAGTQDAIAMLNALPGDAVNVIRNDLQDLCSRERKGIWTAHEATILATVSQTVRAIVQDPSQALPGTINDLGVRLRQPANKDTFASALAKTSCPAELQSQLATSFKQMMSKLAKEIEQAHGAGAAR